jgi:acyl-CoA thioesterase FadM
MHVCAPLAVRLHHWVFLRMSLLLRLLCLVLTSPRRSRLHVLDTCVTPFRVWLNDLDVLFHMNNGRYLTILDLARVDLMMRSGLWKHLKAQRWYPVVTLETIRFHRSLELGNRYNVETRVIGWDEKHIFIEQGFVRGETQVALAVVRARFLKRSGGVVTTAELIGLAGIEQQSPALPEWVARWSEAEGGMAFPSSSSSDRENETVVEQ